MCILFSVVVNLALQLECSRITFFLISSLIEGQAALRMHVHMRISLKI